MPTRDRHATSWSAATTSCACLSPRTTSNTRSRDSILDEHVILINDDGSTQTKSQFLASIKGPTSEEQQVAPESINVRVYGTTAIATGLFHAKGIENGKHYNRYDRFVDTWMFKDGKWVCVATNATPVLH